MAPAGCAAATRQGVGWDVGPVDVDLVGRAAHVPVDDVLQDREEVAQEGPVAGSLGVGADGLEVSQRRVDGVVHGSLAFVREAVGEHAL